MTSTDSLNYKREGLGIPFIFQHGLGSNLQQTLDLSARLVGLEVISMDCPGHGKSPLPDDLNPSFEYYTQCVHDLMQSIKLPRAVLGGISMGSAIALKMALKYPEKVMALVLIRPAWLDQKSPENLRILLDIATMIGQPEGRKRLLGTAEFKQINHILPEGAKSLLGLFEPTQQYRLPDVLTAMVNDRPFSQMEELQSINVPTLVIANDDDPLHPFGNGQKDQPGNIRQ